MATRTKGPWGGWSTLFALIAVVLFVWGFERWRKSAAGSAGRSERARLVALSRCMLGPDGTTVMRSPDATRRRLRELAMATPATASATWFDQCVPLAQALARHASEVDDTTAPTAAQTRVAESARALHQAVSRVALVWRIRAGDPETDMDMVGERLAAVAGEIDLVSPQGPAVSTTQGLVARVPDALPAGELIPRQGLEPAPIGSPARFLVGAPLPSITEIIREGAQWTMNTLANEPSVAWRINNGAMTRIDTLLAPSDDQLAPLRFFRPGADVIEARVTPVNDPLEGLHVMLDATSSGRTLWLAQWTPWNGTVLARFLPGRPATAITLAQPLPDAIGRSDDAARSATTAFDERVAIAPLGAGAVVAYTLRNEAQGTTLILASTPADAERAPVLRLTERVVEGRAPGLEFCVREGMAPLLFVAGMHEWLALSVQDGGVIELARVDGSRRIFDERMIVRCAPDGVVVYAREHARTSPVIACGRGSCESLALPDVPVPGTLPLYTTRTPNGRALAHASWPNAMANTGSALVAARAVGPVVAVARRARGADAWQAERVVFDAALRMHGYVVEGMDIYADHDTLTLAVAAPDGLHLFTSDDGGEVWR